MYKNVPHHVLGYLKKNIKRPKLKDIDIIVFKNGFSRDPVKSMKPGQAYVPIYEDLAEVTKLVKQTCIDLRDDMFIICTFENVDAINERIKEQFEEPIKLIIRESL